MASTDSSPTPVRFRPVHGLGAAPSAPARGRWDGDMRTRGTTRDEGGQREPDLARAAVAIARDEGLEAGERVPSPPGLHRQVVEGGALVRPMVLCVGTGDRDRRRRLAPTVASEHLPEVRELPPRSIRGAPVWSELVEHLPAGSLRRRMSLRAFRVGEAVTILLAACDVLRRLHEAGYGGVSLRAEDVRFREDGCPVLMGAGGVEPLTEERARADSAAFVGLARELAASVGGPAGESLVESVRRAVDGRYGGVRETLLRESLPVAVRVAVEDAADPVDAKAPDTAERWVDRPGGAPPVLIGVDAEVPRGVKRSWRLAGVRRLHWRTDVLLDGDPVGEARAAARKLVQTGRSSCSRSQRRSSRAFWRSRCCRTVGRRGRAVRRYRAREARVRVKGANRPRPRSQRRRWGRTSPGSTVRRPRTTLQRQMVRHRPTAPLQRTGRQRHPSLPRSTIRPLLPCDCWRPARAALATPVPAWRSRSAGEMRRWSGWSRPQTPGRTANRPRSWWCGARPVGGYERCTRDGGQIPRLPSKSPPSRRFFTATRKRAASAPSTMRWSYERAR